MFTLEGRKPLFFMACKYGSKKPGSKGGKKKPK